MRRSRPSAWRTVPLLAVLVVSLGGDCDGAVTLGDELVVDPAHPYNAVGYLNNGCTASLIDADHIVAAAHCFVLTDTGEWQTGLRFYPNFHPDRVDANAAHVPRADVTRAVVGSRAAENRLGVGMDWGIARVDNWRDTAGLDLTPLALAPHSPTVGAKLVNPAYNRHHCPYDDQDDVTWDNMERDTKDCNPAQWIREMQSPPLFDGTNPDSVWCNSRWIAGTIHRDCSITNLSGDVVEDDCVTNGGSSGSPMIVTGSGPWTLAGVVHGGQGPNFAQATPDCTVPDKGFGSSVDRFRDAPRFAENVAVYRRPDNPSATAVFAVDSDLDVVAYRDRVGATPGYGDRFAYWSSLGGPGGELTRIAACAADDDFRPLIVVVGDDDTLHTRAVGGDGAWGAWSTLDLPPGTGAVHDVDATTDSAGRCQLVVTTDGAGIVTRARTAAGAWGGWSTVASGTYEEVTSLRYEGIVYVAMIDAAGALWRTSYRDGVWVEPEALGLTGGVTSWRDVDMTWDELGRGFMLATPVGGDDRLFFVPMYGDAAWTWRWFDTHLWAPGYAPQDAPELLSITGSRWMEDPAGTTSPVVFGTDVDGNVYFVEYTQAPTAGWVLDWKSFYHEVIVY